MELSRTEKRALKSVKHHLENNDLVSFYKGVSQYLSSYGDLVEYFELGDITQWLLDHDINILSYYQNEVYLPAGMFFDCDIDNVVIPDNIIGILQSCFNGCDQLKTVTFSNSGKLTNIGTSAFICCESLSAIKVPEGVEWIAPTAFKGCSNLKEVYIPSSIEKVGVEAFCACHEDLKILVGCNPDNIDWDDIEDYRDRIEWV